MNLAGVCCGPCNLSKWEAAIWGWLVVRRSAMLHYTVNQCPHWACQQYGQPGGTREWLGVKRCQLGHRVHPTALCCTSCTRIDISWYILYFAHPCRPMNLIHDFITFHQWSVHLIYVFLSFYQKSVNFSYQYVCTSSSLQKFKTLTPTLHWLKIF